MNNIHKLLLCLPLCLPLSAQALDILVVVDSSGSMQEATPEGSTRIDAAKSALLKLSPLLTEHELGVLLFGHRIASNQPGACQDIELRLPMGPFSAAEYQLTVAALRPLGATPIGGALQEAHKILQERTQDVPRSVILVTDGNETCGGDPVRVAAAMRAAGLDVQVHVVGFAVGAQQEIQLKAIAKAGAGTYLHAKNASELAEALPEIVKTALRTTRTEELARKTVVQESFDKESLDGWTVLRPDLDRYAAVDGELLILTQHTGDTEDDDAGIGDWHDNPKTKNIVQLIEPLSAPDYEVTVDLELAIASLGQGAALQLRKDDELAIELAYLAHPYGNNILRKFSMNKIIGRRIASVGLSQQTGIAADAEKMTFKIIKRGIVFTGLVKTENPETGEIAWREVGQQALPNLEKAHVAFKASNGWANTPEATCAFDNLVVVENVLRRTVVDSVPEDAHYYTSFDPAESEHHAWLQENVVVIDEDKTHYGLNGGLNIVSQFGKLGDEEHPMRNVILLNRDLPPGDYDIEIQARTRLTNQNSDVGIMLYQDHNTALALGHAAFSGGGYNYNPQFQFEKILKGERSGNRAFISHVRGKEITVLFKIEKRGRKYTGSVYAPTEDGESMAWMRVGEQSILRFQPKLGFYAINHSADTLGRGPAHEVNICFERVIVHPAN